MRRAACAGLLLALAAVPRPGWACSCREFPEFWAVADKAEVVVVATFTGTISDAGAAFPTGFTVRVDEVIKGDEPRETIDLIDNDFSMCSFSPNLPPESRWAIVLKPGDPEEGSFGCSGRIQRIVPQLKLDGRVYPNTMGVTLEEVRARLGKPKAPLAP